MRLLAVRDGMLGVVACFLVLTARLMVRCLAMVMCCRFVMAGRLMMKRGRPRQAAFAPDLFVEFVTVFRSSGLATGLTRFRMLLGTAASGCHDVLLV